LEATAARSHVSHFRPDVEGLRAVAVSMVLLYHLGVGWATGGFAGVDVFFVISGFLITGQLVKEVERTGTIALADFYSRRAKRLFPAAALVLLATVGLTLFTLPPTRWAEIGGDVFASAAYFINWRLAARSVDYLAEDSVPSPVQHFWSLAVEEQYYIIWPVLLFVALFLLRRWLRNRTVLWSTLVAVALPSLAYSIYLTAKDPGPAYFITPTRIWELAIGGAVALSANACRRIPARVAQLLGWFGLAAIAVATVVISARSTPWPGYAAALPTLGAAAVIVSGFSAGRHGPVALLGTRAFCWVGAISYSLYLWHWPLIEAARAYFEQPQLAPWLALAVLAASIVLAWLALTFVEHPIRVSEKMSLNTRYALSAGLNFSFVGAIAGLFLIVFTLQQGGTQVAGGPGAAMGAKALRPNPRGDHAGQPVDKVAWFTPAAEQATRDIPSAYADGCQLDVATTEPKPCIYGRKDGAITVAVVGDSKIVQWMPALEELAEKHDWKLVLNGKSGCGFHSRMLVLDGKPYTQCYEWNRAVLKQLLAERPDYLITSLGRGGKKPNDKEVAALLDWWRPLSDAGVKVIALANNPNPRGNVYECVARNPEKLSTCAFARNPGSGTPSLEAAAAQIPTARFINLNDAICPNRLCPAIIGNVLIYRQGSHITSTYIESLAPRLERELAKAGLN